MEETDVINPHVPLRRNLALAYVQKVAPLALISLLLVGIIALVVELIETKESVKTGITYNEDSVINGSKRFIDFLYSLNSSTVKKDQYQAINMMVSGDLQSERVRYLKETDLIRSVEAAYQRSYIDWTKGGAQIIKTTDKGFVVEIKAALVIDSSDYFPLHLNLHAVPLKPSDKNPTGVGILEIKDVAEEPIF